MSFLTKITLSIFYFYTLFKVLLCINEYFEFCMISRYIANWSVVLSRMPFLKPYFA